MCQMDQTVMYGTIGLCKIAVAMPGEQSYVLEPIYQNTGQLVASFENDTVVRKLLSTEEIEQAIIEAKKAEKVWYSNPGMRELEYRQAVKSCDFKEWLRLSELIRFAKQKSRHDKTMVTTMDTKNQRIFERLLAEEYAAVYGLEKDASKKEIRRRMKEREVD